MKKILTALFLALVASCTSIKVQEVDPSLQVSHVCIQDNPKVIVSEYIPVVRKGFERHGITTEIYKVEKPNYCEYHLTYTALKAWDLGMYMHHAELQLYKGSKPIAYAEYHLNGKGGLDLTKWGSVDSKMDPVINKLLSGYSSKMVDTYRKTNHLSNKQLNGISESKAHQLRDLKKWFEEGLITEQEYMLEKEKVLNL